MSKQYIKLICIDNQNDYLSARKEIEKDDLILTLDQDVIELCKKDSLSCVNLELILNSQEIINKYPDFVDLLYQVNKSIKNDLNDFFNQNNMKDSFDWAFYPLKVLIDQISFYKIVIEKSLSFYSISKIVIRENTDFKFKEKLFLDSNVGLLSLVAKDIAIKNKIKIFKTYFSNYDNAKSSFSLFQWRDYLYLNVKIFLKRIIEFYENFKSITSIASLVFNRKKKYFLSVGCKELETISLNIEKLGIKVIKLNTDFNYKMNYKKFNILGRKFLNTKSYYYDFDYYKYLVPFVGAWVFNIKKLSFRKNIYSKILRYKKPNCIFTQTLTAFNIPTMILCTLAQKMSIKVYCWMHGGYGAYTSLPGYDVTDYKMTNNHIIYGDGAEHTIKSKKSILKSLYPKVQFQTLTLGSPRLDKLYNNKISYNFSGKKIVFSLAGSYHNNNYYFGYNRPYDFLNYWKESKKIICALSNYSNTNDIFIKDYSNSHHKNLVLRLLKQLKNNQITYVSNEISYRDIIINADALIYTWVSTSFIEGIYTSADILLYDNSNITNGAKNVLKQCKIFSSDIDIFIKEMNIYLDKLSINNQHNIFI